MMEHVSYVLVWILSSRVTLDSQIVTTTMMMMTTTTKACRYLKKMTTTTMMMMMMMMMTTGMIRKEIFFLSFMIHAMDSYGIIRMVGEVPTFVHGKVLSVWMANVQS